MPLYCYACPQHGKFDGWSVMDNRHWSQPCPTCMVPSPYRISAPRVFCDFPAYVSPSTGEVVEGRKARLNDMAKSQCRPYEVGEMQDAQRRSKEQEKQLEADIDASVETTLWELKNG